MEELVVTGKKLDVETLIDRKVYSVASDVQSAFGSLSDILSVIPSVDVDGSGLVSLRGDSNVLILVDGKPSAQFSGPAAGDNLQSIAARDIERIEILTTPPAQFKADGAAGVINIVTRKKRAAGGSGSLQGSVGNQGRSIIGADGSYSSGPLTGSVSAGYRHDERRRLIRSDVTANNATPAGVGDSSSSIDEKIRRGVPTLATSGAYALNDRQSVSAAVNWSQRGGLRTYTETNESGMPPGAITGLAQRLSYGHDPETSVDERLGFAQVLGSAGDTLNVSLHRSASHQHERYGYTDDSFIPPLPASYSGLEFRENHGVTEFNADFDREVSKTAAWKLGYSFAQDDFFLGNVASVAGPSGSLPSVDPTLTNDFKFRQRVSALYASYQTRRGAWSWLGGLRAEYVDTNAEQLTNELVTVRSYFELYPSLHIDRTLSEYSTLSLAASRRVTRPDPDNLNPYIDREYTPNLRAGNPGLKPQFSQTYELGYGYAGHAASYGVTGYFRRNQDSVTDVTEYLSNGVSLTTKTNLARNDAAGFELSASGRIIANVSYNLSGNLFYSQIDATALGVAGLRSTTGLNAKIKIDYQASAKDSAQFTVTRTDKKLTPQGYVSAVSIVNLGLKRQVLTDLTAVVTLSDLFNGQRLRRVAALPGFTQEYERTVLGRIFYVGAIYSFGSSNKQKSSNFDYDQSSSSP